jgi:hypothetical protein
MARKKVPRNLGRLPHRIALRGADHISDRLLEILRGAAVKNQQEQPQSFYSVREVAQQFRVPIATVARVYRHLENEGLLSRVRSSKTILQGLHYDRRLSVRAFVGLPASLSAFLTIQDYRMFFIRIRRELRLRGFATAMLFFQPEEIKTMVLSDRLKRYEVDTVIWFLPPPVIGGTALCLTDAGIRLLAVTQGEPSDIPCRYIIRREQAIKALLSEWKSKYFVSKIAVVVSNAQRSLTNEEILRSAIEQLQLDSVIMSYKGGGSGSFLSTLRRSKADGLVFSSSALPSRLCFRRPTAVTNLLRSKRVAFLEGPVNMPFARLPDDDVDLVTVDWQVVAEQIVDDLISQRAFRKSASTVFEAQSHLRVPLSRFAQNL